jgi:hypothetical protein
MNKEELIRLHALLLQMRKWVEANGLAEANRFESYDKLGISPVHVYRDRQSHKTAVFALGEALSSAAVDHRGTAVELKTRLHFFENPHRSEL